MNHSLKFFLPILAIAVTSYGLKTIKQHTNLTSSVLAANKEVENNGLVTINSPYNVKETSDRLSDIIAAKGLTLFARIDHSANAQNAGLELPPTELLIIGNPQVGTPLMQCSATTAIDLPQKILVHQAESDRTQITYNQPKYLQQRHDIEGCDEVLTKIETALKGITEAAASDS